MTTALLALGAMLGALVVGYWIGRFRPVQALDNAAWNRVISGWTATQHLVVWFWVWAVLNPSRAWRAFRHRNDPPKERPTVRLNIPHP